MRARLLTLLDEHILPDADRTVGRPGMDLWQILVLRILRHYPGSDPAVGLLWTSGGQTAQNTEEGVTPDTAEGAAPGTAQTAPQREAAVGTVANVVRVHDIIVG